MVLIDTHVLIWFMFDDSQLSERALSEIKSQDRVYVSISSFWEIAIKQSIGKINIVNSIQDIAEKCTDASIFILGIKPKHLDYIKKLPDIHKDPFDRLIISQAITENMTLITRDTNIQKYNINMLW